MDFGRFTFFLLLISTYIIILDKHVSLFVTKRRITIVLHSMLNHSNWVISVVSKFTSFLPYHIAHAIV